MTDDDQRTLDQVLIDLANAAANATPIDDGLIWDAATHRYIYADE